MRVHGWTQWGFGGGGGQEMTVNFCVNMAGPHVYECVCVCVRHLDEEMRFGIRENSFLLRLLKNEGNKTPKNVREFEW